MDGYYAWCFLLSRITGEYSFLIYSDSDGDDGEYVPATEIPESPDDSLEFTRRFPSSSLPSVAIKPISRQNSYSGAHNANEDGTFDDDDSESSRSEDESSPRITYHEFDSEGKNFPSFFRHDQFDQLTKEFCRLSRINEFVSAESDTATGEQENVNILRVRSNIPKRSSSVYSNPPSDTEVRDNCTVNNTNRLDLNYSVAQPVEKVQSCADSRDKRHKRKCSVI